jgi:hypothetical protein
MWKVFTTSCGMPRPTFGGRKGRTPQFQVCVWLGGSLKAMKKEYRCGLLHLSIAMYNYYT